MTQAMKPAWLQEIEDDYSNLLAVYRSSHPQLDCDIIAGAERKVLAAVPGLLQRLKLSMEISDILLERLEETSDQTDFAG